MDKNQENKDEVIGYLKTISSPSFISSRYKYTIEVRSYAPIGRLEYINFEIQNNFADILDRRKLKRGRGRVGKIIEKFDKEEGNTFYHYLFYISCNENYDVGDVAERFRSHLERKENCKIQSASGEQIKLWPWEKDKVTMKIPITRGMIDKVVEKIKKEKEKKDD